MNTSTMLRAFCDAVEQRNGKAFAELFTEDGVYHDVFYGAAGDEAAFGGVSTVIPGRAKREPGIQRLWSEIPGSSLRDAPE